MRSSTEILDDIFHIAHRKYWTEIFHSDLPRRTMYMPSNFKISYRE